MSYFESYIVVCSSMLMGAGVTCLVGAIMPPLGWRFNLTMGVALLFMSFATRPLIMAMVLP